VQGLAKESVSSRTDSGIFWKRVTPLSAAARLRVRIVFTMCGMLERCCSALLDETASSTLTRSLRTILSGGRTGF
jgi:hypothetical protein